MSQEAQHGVVLSGAVWVDDLSLRNFLEILLGLRPEYDSNDASSCSPPHEYFYIGDGHATNTALSSRSRLEPNKLCRLPQVEGRVPPGLVGRP